MKILIIKLGAIGDVVRTTFVLQGLREKYPDPQIHWLTGAMSADVLRGHPYIDSTHVYSAKTCEALQSIPFDLVINLDDDQEACVVTQQLQTRKLVGAYIEGERRVYTENSAPWFDMGLISRFGKAQADALKKQNRKTFQSIIASVLEINEYKPAIYLSDSERDYGLQFRRKNRIPDDALTIGVNTSGGTRWKYKSLGVPKTIEVIERIQAQYPESAIVLLGGPAEVDRNQTILDATGVIDGGCDNSLREFASLISVCNVIVTSDSLAMNLAVAFNKYVVAFFSVSPASEIEGYGKMEKVVAPVECICCLLRDCDKQPNCMDVISSDAIFQKLQMVTDKGLRNDYRLYT